MTSIKDGLLITTGSDKGCAVKCYFSFNAIFPGKILTPLIVNKSIPMNEHTIILKT